MHSIALYEPSIFKILYNCKKILYALILILRWVNLCITGYNPWYRGIFCHFKVLSLTVHDLTWEWWISELKYVFKSSLEGLSNNMPNFELGQFSYPIVLECLSYLKCSHVVCIYRICKPSFSLLGTYRNTVPLARLVVFITSVIRSWGAIPGHSSCSILTSVATFLWWRWMSSIRRLPRAKDSLYLELRCVLCIIDSCWISACMLAYSMCMYVCMFVCIPYGW